MAKQQQQNPGQQQSQSDEKQGSDETFTTDVSETDSEGTTVREAEVRKDDLSEVDPATRKDQG
jgi:hypothetical protein